jgi:hypothetical protein
MRVVIKQIMVIEMNKLLFALLVSAVSCVGAKDVYAGKENKSSSEENIERNKGNGPVKKIKKQKVDGYEIMLMKGDSYAGENTLLKAAEIERYKMFIRDGQLEPAPPIRNDRQRAFWKNKIDQTHDHVIIQGVLWHWKEKNSEDN